MTRNQIAYNEMMETRRTNRIKEAETERANMAREAENTRTNLANEAIGRRKNEVTEKVGLMKALATLGGSIIGGAAKSSIGL